MRDGLEPPTHCFECSCSTIELCRETYQDVLPQSLDMTLIIPNTTRLMPFSLRDTQPCFRTTFLPDRSPWHCPSPLAANLGLIGLPVLHRHWMDSRAWRGLRVHFALTVGLGSILSDQAPSSCLPRGSSHGPFRAGAGLHGWITCVTLVRRVSSFGPVAGLIL